MATGIRATVEFPDEDICPLTELSATNEAAVHSVSSNVRPSCFSPAVTEFSMDANCQPDGSIERIFSHGDVNRYRLTHEDGVDCPCECLGEYGCPVVRYTAQNGVLTLVFHATDYEQLQDIVTELRERYPDVEIKRFIRSPGGDQSPDSVFVERGKLTDRQLEVLSTAYEMGYFQRPRKANAKEVASELGVDPSTFSEHLATAEAKLFEDVLEE